MVGAVRLLLLKTISRKEPATKQRVTELWRTPELHSTAFFAASVVTTDAGNGSSLRRVGPTHRRTQQTDL
jgi:hypothetical protein